MQNRFRHVNSLQFSSKHNISGEGIARFNGAPVRKPASKSKPAMKSDTNGPKRMVGLIRYYSRSLTLFKSLSFVGVRVDI